MKKWLIFQSTVVLETQVHSSFLMLLQQRHATHYHHSSRSLLSVHFFVGSIGRAYKCPLEFSLLLLSELAHHPHTELLNLLHSFLRILTSQELNVAEGVGETNLKTEKNNSHQQW